MNRCEWVKLNHSQGRRACGYSRVRLAPSNAEGGVIDLQIHHTSLVSWERLGIFRSSDLEYLYFKLSIYLIGNLQ